MQKRTMISGTDLRHIENNALKIFQSNKNQIHSTSPEDATRWNSEDWHAKFNLEFDTLVLKHMVEAEEILQKFAILRAALNRHKWKSIKIFKLSTYNYMNWYPLTAEAMAKSICRTFPELQEFELYAGPKMPHKKLT